MSLDYPCRDASRIKEAPVLYRGSVLARKPNVSRRLDRSCDQAKLKAAHCSTRIFMVGAMRVIIFYLSNVLKVLGLSWENGGTHYAFSSP